MSDWYYAANNEQKGPINESELKAHLAGNQLPPDTLVWKEGMDNWTPANQVPAFSFRPPPTPAKVQPPTPGAVPAPDAPAAAPSSTTPVDFSKMLGKGEALEVDPEDAEKNKVFGILAYLGILFLVPMLAAKDSPFAKYHANQGLVLFLVEIVYWIAASILIVILSMIGLGIIGLLFQLVGIAFLILIILGIINAAAGKCLPLPVIGGIKILK